MDNTLYDDHHHGIEGQIVANIRRFVADDDDASGSNNVTAAALSDELHRRYGSTIEGLRETVWRDLEPPELLRRQKNFYEGVYPSVDVSSLLAGGRRLRRHQPSDRDDETDTGYAHHRRRRGPHHDEFAHQRSLRRILLLPPPPGSRRGADGGGGGAAEWHLASNSPVSHVQKVVQAMGLARVPWRGVWTPDCRGTRRGRTTTAPAASYPTKRHPTEFWGRTFLEEEEEEDGDAAKRQTVLVDDSATAIEAGRGHFAGILVGSGRSVQEALGVALGWLSANYTFSDVEYLRAKNVVDARALNRETWNRLCEELSRELRERQSSEGGVALNVVDVGAGLLSMLRWMLQGDDGLPSLVGNLQEKGVPVQGLHYYAYEPNINLRSACIDELLRLGFTPLKRAAGSRTNSDDELKEMIFVQEANSLNQLHCVVHLRFCDYKQCKDSGTPQPTPHLIVGCCFADLLEPYDLVTSLMRNFLCGNQKSSDGNHTLVYLPITFCGITQFVPPQPFETIEGRTRTIPSDTTAFRLYSKALVETHGHNLDPDTIVSCFSDYGAVRLHHGRADWTIDPSQHSYLWETMLYFFGTVAAPEIRFAGWDARGWLGRARKRRPTIHVSNVDLLFRVPHLGRWQLNAEQNDRTLRNNPPADRYKEIQFIAPHQVRVISKVPNGLEPHEVRVESVYSLISSGTELKIFKGLFEDASLDVNIKGMEEERMAYPLAYGYSLVGRIVECGRGVEGREQLLGRLVFTFSAHSSQVTADLSAVHLVPDGIGALDAIFMPSVETALSLVQDARPLLGEKIAVFGQGLIGLLVTALLRRHAIHSSSGFGTITTFDTLRDRLAASSAMGASQALMPSEAASTGPFDVSIEVSGSGRALQTAIDSTRDGGRIVIGSWYGDKVINLKLGTDFHRSHKTLKASQVSTLPSEMMKTWTKERRFALTWDLVRDIRPSCLLTRTTTIDYAQEAYEALEKGNEIAVAFEYN